MCALSLFHHILEYLSAMSSATLSLGIESKSTNILPLDLAITPNAPLSKVERRGIFKRVGPPCGTHSVPVQGQKKSRRIHQNHAIKQRQNTGKIRVFKSGVIIKNVHRAPWKSTMYALHISGWWGSFCVCTSCRLCQASMWLRKDYIQEGESHVAHLLMRVWFEYLSSILRPRWFCVAPNHAPHVPGPSFQRDYVRGMAHQLSFC